MTIKILTPNFHFHFNFYSLFIQPMLFVQPVHQPDIDEDQNDKHINRSLLCNPEAQFDASDSILIKIGFPEDAAAIRNKKPDRQQHAHVGDVFLPICFGVELLHRIQSSSHVSPQSAVLSLHPAPASGQQGSVYSICFCLNPYPPSTALRAGCPRTS